MHDEMIQIGIRLLEPYKGAKVKHLMECMECLHQWHSTPTQKKQSFRKHGTNGCPKCKHNKPANSTSDGECLDVVALQSLITAPPSVLREWLGVNSAARELIVNRTKFLNPDARIRQRMWHVVNGQDAPTCTVCGALVTWNVSTNQYRQFCSSACALKVVEVDRPSQDHDTILQRINTKHGTAFQSIKEAYASGLYARSCADRTAAFADSKAKGTHKQKIVNQETIEAAKVKRSVTNMERYGAGHPMKVTDIAKAAHQTKASRALFSWAGRNPTKPTTTFNDIHNPNKLRALNQTLNLREIGDLYGYSKHYISQIFTRLNIPVHRHFHSTVERKVTNWLDELGVEVVINDRRILSGAELDLVLPEHQIAIEVNGTWWHSECNGSKGRKYHIGKTLQARDRGYTVLHFWDFEIEQKPNIVQSMIRHRLKLARDRIFARNCEVVSISQDQAREFFVANHLAGYTPAKVNIALVHNGEIVQCASFSTPRFSKQHEWELIRLATLLDTVVVGGASKLLHCFIKTYDVHSIISYADRRYSTGGVYRGLGMKELPHSSPNYWYFHTNSPHKLIHRASFQKHKLETKLQTFDASMTEWENMKANGYDRVWDCGNLVFELQL